MASLFMSNEAKLKQQMRQNKRSIDKEIRNITRDMKEFEREDARLKAKIKKEAQTGNNAAVRQTAKQIVRTKKQLENMNRMKDSLFSVKMQMTGMKSMQAMSTAMNNMTKMMSKMNKQINPAKFAKIMAKFEQEAAKAEMTEELMSDTLGDALGDDDVAEEDLVNQVLEEAGLTATGDLAAAPLGAPQSKVAQQDSDQKEAIPEGADDVNELEERLRKLNRGDDV